MAATATLPALKSYRYFSTNQSEEQELWQQRWNALKGIADANLVQMPEDERGLWTKTTDFLLRPNYAIAGAFEEAVELVTGQEPDALKGAVQIPSRIMAELFDTKNAQRETFADVIRQHRLLPEVSLSDLIDRTLPIYLDPSLPGTVGLIADIFLDPTMYVRLPFFGATAAAKVIGRGGRVSYVNKKGRAFLGEMHQRRLEQAAKTFGFEDRVAAIKQMPKRKQNSEFAELLDELDLAMTTQRSERLAMNQQKYIDDYMSTKGPDAAEPFRKDAWIRQQDELHSKLLRLAERDVDDAIRGFDRGFRRSGRDRGGRFIKRQPAPVPRQELLAGKKVQFMGKDILDIEPGLKAGKDLLVSLFGRSDKMNAIGRMLVKGYDGLDLIFNQHSRAGRAIPGFKEATRRWEDRKSQNNREVNRVLKELFPDSSTDTPLWHTLTEAIDGSRPMKDWIDAAVQSWGPKLGAQAAAQKAANAAARIQFLQRMDFQRTASLGAFKNPQKLIEIYGDPADASRNWSYMSHILKDTGEYGKGFVKGEDAPEQLMDLISRWKTSKGEEIIGGRPSIAPFQELRAFRTMRELDDFKAWAAKRTDLKPEAQRAIAEMEFLKDPRAILAQRLTVGGEAIATERYVRELGLKWAISTGHDFAMLQHKLFKALRPMLGDEFKWRDLDVGPGGKKGHRVAADVYDALTNRFASEGWMFDDAGRLASHRFDQTEEWVTDFIKRAGAVWDDDTKAAFIGAVMQNVEDLGHFDRVMKALRPLMDDISTPAWFEMHNILTVHGRNRIGLDGKPMKFVKLPRLFGGSADEVGVPNTRQGIWLPEAIAEDLRRWDRHELLGKEINDLLRPGTMATNLFKRLVTAPWLPFHIRNAYSNVFQNLMEIGLAALNPKYHMQTIRILLGHDGTMIANNGIRYTYAHVRSLLQAHDVVVEFSKIADIVPSRTAVIQGRTKAAKVVGAPIRLGERFGTRIEQEARALHFIYQLQQGKTPAHAAEVMKAFMFDYGDLTLVEREIFRNIMPFYTWNSKAIRLNIKNMFSRPGLVASVQKPFNQRGPEEDVLPEYLRGELKVGLGKNKKGGHSFLMGIDLPQKNIDMLFSGSIRSTLLQNISSLNPFLKAPLEYAFNMESFTGRSIKGQQWMGKWGPMITKLDKRLGGYLEATEVEMPDGTVAYKANGTKVYLLFKTWAASRFMSHTSDWVNLLDDMGDVQLFDFWRMASGMQFREYDLTQEQLAMVKNRYRKLEEELIDRGVIRRVKKTILNEGKLPPQEPSAFQVLEGAKR